MTYYVLQQDSIINKVLIVEDDKSISKLMAITIGKGAARQHGSGQDDCP